MYVPEWVEREVRFWGERLHLDGWEVGVEMVQLISNIPGAEGSCTYNTRNREATIRLRSDISDDRGGQGLILHEMKHIEMSGLDNTVSNIIEQLPEGARALATRMWDDELEHYLDHNAKVMHKLREEAREAAKGKRRGNRASRTKPRTTRK